MKFLHFNLQFEMKTTFTIFIENLKIYGWYSVIVYDAILLKDLSATDMLMIILSLRIKYYTVIIFLRVGFVKKITSPIQFHSFILIQIKNDHW
jgi:hypothetical protein